METVPFHKISIRLDNSTVNTFDLSCQPCHDFRPVKKVSWRTCLKETESVFKNILGRIYIKVSNYTQYFRGYVHYRKRAKLIKVRSS
jgi:hypothetical protein